MSLAFDKALIHILQIISFQIFSSGDGNGYNDLWYITWDIIGEFLPNLKDELFPEGNKLCIENFRKISLYMQTSGRFETMKF